MCVLSVCFFCAGAFGFSQAAQLPVVFCSARVHKGFLRLCGVGISGFGLLDIYIYTYCYKFLVLVFWAWGSQGRADPGSSASINI